MVTFATVVDSQPVYHHCLLFNLPEVPIIRASSVGSDAAQENHDSCG